VPVTVDTTDDAITENDEVYSVDLSGPSANATIGSQDSVDTTIIDNDESAFVGRYVYSFAEANSEGATDLIRIDSELGTVTQVMRLDDSYSIQASSHTTTSFVAIGETGSSEFLILVDKATLVQTTTLIDTIGLFDGSGETATNGMTTDGGSIIYSAWETNSGTEIIRIDLTDLNVPQYTNMGLISGYDVEALTLVGDTFYIVNTDGDLGTFSLTSLGTISTSLVVLDTPFDLDSATVGLDAWIDNTLLSVSTGGNGQGSLDSFNLDTGETLPIVTVDNSTYSSSGLGSLITNAALEQEGTDGVDNLVGTPFDDVIFGLDGEDTIHSGDGFDQLIGGLGSDELTGGADVDTFIYSEGDGGVTIALADVIIDFEDGVDFIGLDGLTFGSADGEVSFVAADVVEVGANAGDTAIVINDGVGYSEILAVIQGVSVGSLTVDDVTEY